MGDIRELTTWPGKEMIYYKATSGGIIFSIKAINKSTIGLATHPCGKNDISIVMGSSRNIYLLKGTEIIKVRSRVDITESEYTTFWLAWTRFYVKLGLQGESFPLISTGPKIPHLCYITFGTHEGIDPTYWKFELPPLMHGHELKPLDSGIPQWVKCDDELPDGVIIGGFEDNAPTYIIRAHHAGSLTPGKFIPAYGLGFIPWGGISNEKSDLEALVGFNIAWVKTSDADIPAGAVIGGYSEVHNEPLFVGRAKVDGKTVPGKVQASHKVCYVPYREREIAKKTYEVLVVPGYEKSREIQISAADRMNHRLQSAANIIKAAIDELE